MVLSHVYYVKFFQSHTNYTGVSATRVLILTSGRTRQFMKLFFAKKSSISLMSSETDLLRNQAIQNQRNSFSRGFLLLFNVETLQAFGALFQIPYYYRKFLYCKPKMLCTCFRINLIVIIIFINKNIFHNFFINLFKLQ
jgi:hypothetical protein